MNYKIRSQKGQAIVELALVLPLLCLIVLGIIEFGVVYYNKAMLTNASREGARAGIVYIDPDGDGVYNPHPTSDIVNAVNLYLTGRLIDFGGSATWNTSVEQNDPMSPGGRVAVRVSYVHTFMAFPRFLSWNTVTISARTIMRVE